MDDAINIVSVPALGEAEGLLDGVELGDVEGEELGDAEGVLEGDGDSEGELLGEAEGVDDGLAEGLLLGVELGDTEGEELADDPPPTSAPSQSSIVAAMYQTNSPGAPPELMSELELSLPECSLTVQANTEGLPPLTDNFIVSPSAALWERKPLAILLNVPVMHFCSIHVDPSSVPNA